MLSCVLEMANVGAARQVCLPAQVRQMTAMMQVQEFIQVCMPLQPSCLELLVSEAAACCGDYRAKALSDMTCG